LSPRVALLAALIVCVGCASTGRKQPVNVVPLIEDLSNYDTPPTVVTPAKPAYPDFAREVGAEGRVVLKVLVLENGRVGAIQVMESSHPVLTGNAVDAVEKCLFSPATLEGKPVKATVVMPFVFNINPTAKNTSVIPENAEPGPSPGVEVHEPQHREEPPVRSTK
jgi:TonB family protein